jgi:hypothetical protein
VLETAIGRLPHGQRIVFIMRHYEGFSSVRRLRSVLPRTVKRRTRPRIGCERSNARTSRWVDGRQE